MLKNKWYNRYANLKTMLALIIAKHETHEKEVDIWLT